MVEVVTTDVFKDWYRDLEESLQEDVEHVVGLLELKGLQLGSPHSSEIKGTDLALRELRPRKGASPVRVFYIFDPRRRAVLLLGGAKESRFYERAVPECERIYEE